MRSKGVLVRAGWETGEIIGRGFMDWIKVLNRHVLLEYNDLRDSEFTAWIKIMALTAQLEHEPTYDQILKYVHHKTLTSLQDKLKKHSTSLQDVLKKVSIDVQYVVKRREALKRNTQRYRDKQEIVIDDVMITSLLRHDRHPSLKRREEEEYIKEEDKEEESPPFPKPKKESKKHKTSLQEDFTISLAVREWAKKKGYDRLDEHLESFKSKCRANGYQYIDWDSAFMEAIRSDWAKLRSGGNGNGNRQQSHNGPGGLGLSEISTPKEWEGDGLPPSDEERKRNLNRVQDLVKTITN